MKVLDPCGCFPTGRHYPGIAHLLKVQVEGLAEEFEPDTPWVDCRIAFVDTETTGVDAQKDRVIEVGIVIGQNGELGERHNWLIQPGIPIPKSATEIHGISDDDVRDKPTFAEVIGEIAEAFEGAIPAAYNAGFDRGFIIAEIDRAGFTAASPPALRRGVAWLDPLVFAREFHKGKGVSRALGAVAERLGIELSNAHRATDDAEAALRVLYVFASDARMPASYGALVQEQRRLERIQREAQRFWRK